MDCTKGRTQTTRGIWLAYVGSKPSMVIMDVEGTDGRERGQDGKKFEKQSALFSLAISDVVIINMWCHDIGREHAGNRPLLMTVFEVMLRLFNTGKSNPRKSQTTLLFVIRDKTQTSFEILEEDLKKDINEIWDSVPKTKAQKGTPLDEFFKVEVVALSNYESDKNSFKQEVASLKKRIFNSIALDRVAGHRQSIVPASAFSFCVKDIWETIKQNKDLDLPSEKVKVATVRCEEIANDTFNSFTSDMVWQQLEIDVRYGLVPGFGKKVDGILTSCLMKYDNESEHYAEGVKREKRQQLKLKVLQEVLPAYKSMLEHLRSRTLYIFKKDFANALHKGEVFTVAAHSWNQNSMQLFLSKYFADASIKQASWSFSEAKNKLEREIREHVAAVRNAQSLKIVAQHEEKLNLEFATQVVTYLQDDTCTSTWVSIEKLLKLETELSCNGLHAALSSLEIDPTNMVSKLRDYARKVVETKAREEAKDRNVMYRMTNRFCAIFFSFRNNLSIETWKEDLDAAIKTAYLEALKPLAIMAAIRLDGEADSIYNILSNALTSELTTSNYLLASETWRGVPSTNTLITPVKCKSLWNQFVQETNNFPKLLEEALRAAEEKEETKRPGLKEGLTEVLKRVAHVAFNALLYRWGYPLKF